MPGQARAGVAPATALRLQGQQALCPGVAIAGGGEATQPPGLGLCPPSGWRRLDRHPAVRPGMGRGVLRWQDRSRITDGEAGSRAMGNQQHRGGHMAPLDGQLAVYRGAVAGAGGRRAVPSGVQVLLPAQAGGCAGRLRHGASSFDPAGGHPAMVGAWVGCAIRDGDQFRSAASR